MAGKRWDDTHQMTLGETLESGKVVLPPFPRETPEEKVCLRFVQMMLGIQTYDIDVIVDAALASASPRREYDDMMWRTIDAWYERFRDACRPRLERPVRLVEDEK